MQDVAENFFSAVNDIRDGRPPLDFGDDDDTNDHYFAQVDVYRQQYFTQRPYRWSEAISRAIRHVLNDQGPCGTVGSMSSELIPEVLTKYYAYSYEDLHIVEFNTHNIYVDGGDSDDFSD